MSYTLDVRGDQTFVLWGDEVTALVKPDAYHPELGRWTSWRQTGNRFDANSGWEFEDYHPTRDSALAACGYYEGCTR